MSIEGVGIIMPRNIYRQIPKLSGNLKSMFRLFERSAAKNNLIPCYIRLINLHPEKKSVEAYVNTSKGYKLIRVPRPNVNYSRIIDKSPIIRRRILALHKVGVLIFNVPNYDIEKYKIHQLLTQEKTIIQHLPHTTVLTQQNLRKMMTSYPSLILKKDYGERGIGAMKIDQEKDDWTLSYKPQNSSDYKKVHFKSELPAILQEHIDKGDYIIQERIPLATFNGNPFDMRVALQKDCTGIFKVTGIMCKVAKNNSFLTNGSQGGETYRLEDIYPKSFPSIPYLELRKNICDLALKTANYLDKHYLHLADLGFDICVTAHGKPYFIECNFISDYVGGLFHEQKILHDEWSAVFTTPLDYARYLIDQHFAQ